MRLTLLLIISVGATLLIACGSDEEETSLLKPEETTINFIGEMKRSDTTNAPAAPQMPSAGTPTVTEINYYSDWQLTKPLTGTVQAGTTIYTKVVFSELMQHLVSDAGNAKPILFYVIGSQETRYRMTAQDAEGENFQSGDGKPLDAGTDDYTCKYTVQTDDQGAFTLKVGKSSVDADGNRLADHYVHGTTLQLGQQTTPEVTEVNYYSDWQLTKPLEGTVSAGTTIYTKVVFSEPVRHLVSDGKEARPVLFYLIGGKETRYRMKAQGAAGESFQRGDGKPLNDSTDDYICKYTVQAGDAGAFTLKVGKFSVDTDGNPLADTYTHGTTLSLGLATEAPATEETPATVPPMGSEGTQAPTVVEISHYSNGGLTKPLMGSIEAGKTVFTKVVFSEDVSYIPANDVSAVPDIRHVLSDIETQYDVLPIETRRSKIRSGDCKPIGGTQVFLCRKSIPGHVTGEFSVNVGGVPFDSAPLTIEVPPAPRQSPKQGLEKDAEVYPAEGEIGTVVLPKDGEVYPAEIGTVVLPKAGVIRPEPPKTALQIEVEEAKTAGLIGNSPLVQAIKITDRIFYRIEKEAKDLHTSTGVYAGIEDYQEKLSLSTLRIRKIVEEEGMPLLSSSIFSFQLPFIYSEATGYDQGVFTIHIEQRYWMTVEYLRIAFEYPELDEQNRLVQYYLSVKKGRVNLSSIRPR